MQFGAAAIDQLRAAGLTPGAIADRVDAGDWRLLCPGVVALAGAPVVWEQGAMAVTLAPGRCAVSHGSALRLHGLDGFTDFDELHAMTHRGGRAELPTGTILHRSRRFDPATQVVLCHDVRTMNVACSLVLSAGFHPDEAVGKALDDALRRGAPLGWLSQTAQRWSGRGVPGSRVLATMLAERIGTNLPRSWYERLANEAFDRSGIVLRHEYAVVDGGRHLCTIDLAAPEVLVGIECQSTRWHADPTARHHDLRRKRRLRALGWEIVEVWYADLHRMDDVVADVLLAVERQRRLLAR